MKTLIELFRIIQKAKKLGLVVEIQYSTSRFGKISAVVWSEDRLIYHAFDSDGLISVIEKLDSHENVKYKVFDKVVDCIEDANQLIETLQELGIKGEVEVINEAT